MNKSNLELFLIVTRLTLSGLIKHPDFFSSFTNAVVS